MLILINVDGNEIMGNGKKLMGKKIKRKIKMDKITKIGKQRKLIEKKNPKWENGGNEGK